MGVPSVPFTLGVRCGDSLLPKQSATQYDAIAIFNRDMGHGVIGSTLVGRSESLESFSFDARVGDAQDPTPPSSLRTQ